MQGELKGALETVLNHGSMFPHCCYVWQLGVLHQVAETAVSYGKTQTELLQKLLHVGHDFNGVIPDSKH